MGPGGTESSVIKPKGVNSKHSRVGIGTVARAVSKEEKYPKECKEDPKKKQEKGKDQSMLGPTCVFVAAVCCVIPVPRRGLQRHGVNNTDSKRFQYRSSLLKLFGGYFLVRESKLP